MAGVWQNQKPQGLDPRLKASLSWELPASLVKKPAAEEKQAVAPYFLFHTTPLLQKPAQEAQQKLYNKESALPEMMIE